MIIYETLCGNFLKKQPFIFKFTMLKLHYYSTLHIQNGGTKGKGTLTKFRKQVKRPTYFSADLHKAYVLPTTPS